MSHIPLSEPIGDDDTTRRSLAVTVIEKSNEVSVDFAKQLVTVAFSATGLVLALKDKWLAADDTFGSVLLAAGLVLFLASALTSTLAVAGRNVPVSLSDYQDVDADLVRIAHERAVITWVAVALLAVGALLTAWCAFRASLG